VQAPRCQQSHPQGSSPRRSTRTQQSQTRGDQTSRCPNPSPTPLDHSGVFAASLCVPWANLTISDYPLFVTLRGGASRLLLTLARAGDAAVRYSIRLSPTEAQRTLGVTLVVGAACGLLAVAFHTAILAADRILIGPAQAAQGPWWIVLTLACPALGGLCAGLVLTYAFPAARGSGIPQVKAAYGVQTERIRLRDGAAKFGITALQVGAGASLGREGPTVHMCAALSCAVGRWFALSPRSVRRLLPVGAAAGVAAAFNAPIAAVTFTVEEIVGGLDQTVLSGVVVAAALAAVIEHTLLGSHPIFTLSQSVSLQHVSALPLHALLGVLAGFTSLAFNRSLLGLRKAFQRDRLVPDWAKPALGGLVTGACAVSALALVHSTGIAGGGYAQLAQALNGSLPLTTLLVLGVLKFAATLFSYSSGGAGGVFAPALFIGAMLGGSVGWLEHLALGHQEMGTFALVGMGAVFAGIIRAPITSVLIIFEMTGGYDLVLPLMIANTTAYLIARKFDPLSLYDALLEQDGIHLVHGSVAPNQLEGLRVDQAMTSKVATVDSELTALEALNAVEHHPFAAYPVVDAQRRCLGLINLARLRRVIAEGGAARRVTELSRLKEYVYPHDLLIRAVVRMNAIGTRQLPVVSKDVHELRGMLTMSDIFRTHAEAAEDTPEAESSRPSLID
jgi:chloride channel protein, CIC family